jgi:hypothetical protein
LTGVIALLIALSMPLDTTLFQTTFDQEHLDLEHTWLVEGTGRAWIEDGRMYVQEDSNGIGVVAWLRQTFPDRMQLEFDVEFSNNRCIGVFFIAASGFQGKRTGDYEEYIRGDLDSYGFSFHRYFPDGRNNPGANARRNSGFHLLSQAMPDPMLEDGKSYSVQITKDGGHLTARVDGNLVHDVTDDGSNGPPHGAGRIGFRLRGHESCVMSLDDIRISTQF